jgi:hypothetical protein
MSKLLLIAGALLAVVAGCESRKPTITAAEPEGDGALYVAVDTPESGKALDQYWIAVAPEGSPDTAASHVRFVDRGTVAVRIRPVDPGNYEVRLHGSYPRKAHDVVDRRRVEVR